MLVSSCQSHQATTGCGCGRPQLSQTPGTHASAHRANADTPQTQTHTEKKCCRQQAGPPTQLTTPLARRLNTSRSTACHGLPPAVHSSSPAARPPGPTTTPKECPAQQGTTRLLHGWPAGWGARSSPRGCRCRRQQPRAQPSLLLLHHRCRRCCCSTRAHAPRSADGAAVCDACDVQVLGPLLLHVAAGEGAGAQRLLRATSGNGGDRQTNVSSIDQTASRTHPKTRNTWLLVVRTAAAAEPTMAVLQPSVPGCGAPAAYTPPHLRLVHGPPAWHAQHKRALVRGGGAGCDAEAGVPAAVDALRGVLEVQLHTLQGEKKQGHNAVGIAGQTLLLHLGREAMNETAQPWTLAAATSRLLPRCCSAATAGRGRLRRASVCSVSCKQRRGFAACAAWAALAPGPRSLHCGS